MIRRSVWLLFQPSPCFDWTWFDDLSQQTFVLMKASFAILFRRRLQDDLIKTNIFTLVIRLQDIFKTSSRRLAKTSSRRLQDVFKTSSGCLQDIFKTSSIRFEDVFEDVFKTSCKDVFKTFSGRIVGLICSC